MASGDTLFKFFPLENQPPATLGATPDQIVAATALRLVLDFDGAADEFAYFEDFWPDHYGGGGIDIKYHYSMDGTDQDLVELEFSVEVLQDLDDQDAGGQDFGTVTAIQDTPATAVANALNVTAAGAITHANCGSPSAGDRMRLQVQRDISAATNTDDLQLHGIYITET